MLTRPTRVPIIPHAGPMAPKFFQKPIFPWCLVSVFTRSASSMLLTSSGSVPSTMSITPFFMNSSSRLFALSSKARSPSRLARFERSMMLLMVSTSLAAGTLNISVNDLSPLIKSCMGFIIKIAPKAPPKVTSAEGASRKFMTAEKLLPNTIPNIMSPRHIIIPINDAKSNLRHLIVYIRRTVFTFTHSSNVSFFYNQQQGRPPDRRSLQLPFSFRWSR